MENQLRLHGGFNPHCGIYHRLEDVFYGIVVLTVVFASRSTGRPAGWPAAPGSSWSSHYYLDAPHPVKWFLIGGWEQLEREQATISPGHIPTLKIYNQRYYLKAWVTILIYRVSEHELVFFSGVMMLISLVKLWCLLDFSDVKFFLLAWGSNLKKSGII